MENVRNRRQNNPLDRQQANIRKLLAAHSFRAASCLEKIWQMWSCTGKRYFWTIRFTLGMCILDISKSLMYDFYCKNLKIRGQFELLYTDTETFLLQVQTDRVYKDMVEDAHIFKRHKQLPKGPPVLQQKKKKTK